MKSMLLIDINCDLGEGFDDHLLMPYISSANIATGFHAGNPTIMSSCIDLCLANDVKPGAHPSFWDRENFGRISQNISLKELYDILQYQIGALYQMCQAKGAVLHHVKPHGALYNQSASDIGIAETIAKAVKSIDENLILYGLAGSLSLDAAKEEGLQAYAEGFADRRYLASGHLVPRAQPDACHTNIEESVQQAERFAHKKSITAIDGKEISLNVDTICIHSDHEGADILAKMIYDQVKES